MFGESLISCLVLSELMGFGIQQSSTTLQLLTEVNSNL